MYNVTLTDLTFSYIKPGQLPLLVLAGVNARFKAGCLSVLIGPSGCGKSTILNIIARLLQPSSGRVDYDLPESKRLRKVGYVFQAPTLIPWRTVRGNALFGAEIAGTRDSATDRWCDELLATYGLAPFGNLYPSALSGGMQQRVSIIRAVLSGARILLLDEPFSGSDRPVQRDLQRNVSVMIGEHQLVAVLVTHNLEEAVRIGDKVFVLCSRPSRVLVEIDIPIPREERLGSKAGTLQSLAPYVDRIAEVLEGLRNNDSCDPR